MPSITTELAKMLDAVQRPGDFYASGATEIFAPSLEATGNAGASFDRTYRRAGLVLWPRGRRLAVLNQAGLSATLPYLGELTQRWVESGEGPESPLWRQAHELARHMLRTWPRQGRHWRTDAESSEARKLALLNRLRNTTRLDAFLADLSAAGAYSQSDNAALVEALDRLPSARAAELIERIIAGNAGAALGACGDLLARCAARALKANHRVDCGGGAAGDGADVSSRVCNGDRHE